MGSTALALAALGLAAACTPDGDDAATDTTASVAATDPASGSSATGDPATSGATAPPVPVRPAPAGWVDAGVDPDVFGSASVTDALALDGRLVAVGCKRSAAGTDLPIWTSPDGTSWQRATAPDGFGDGGSVECLTDVVATPVGLFAHGQILLHSVDGTAWKEVPLLDRDGQLTGLVTAVFPRVDGVAVLTHSASLNESTEAHLWTSTAGVTFTREPDTLADVFDNAGVSQVLALGTGLIALGASPWGEFVPTAAVWTSADGLRWELVTPAGAGFSDAYIQAVTEVGDGFLAVGADPFGTGLMAAWAGTADGRSWERLPPPDETADPESAMGRVAYQEAVAVSVVDGVVHAAGHEYDARRAPGDEDRVAQWTSADHVTFLRVDTSALDGVAVPFNVVRSGDRRVGFWPPPRWLDAEPVQVLLAPIDGG